MGCRQGPVHRASLLHRLRRGREHGRAPVRHGEGLVRGERLRLPCGRRRFGRCLRAQDGVGGLHGAGGRHAGPVRGPVGPHEGQVHRDEGSADQRGTGCGHWHRGACHHRTCGHATGLGGHCHLRLACDSHGGVHQGHFRPLRLRRGGQGARGLRSGPLGLDDDGQRRAGRVDLQQPQRQHARRPGVAHLGPVRQPGGGLRQVRGRGGG
mmetsp:Transcript_66704/g.214895  ORF Transcript_66704/g.214895 Transcript_66704/m.214895 type:complete len:209 (+) Transcript_66704:1297-1923(+)